MSTRARSLVGESVSSPIFLRMILQWSVAASALLFIAGFIIGISGCSSAGSSTGGSRTSSRAEPRTEARRVVESEEDQLKREELANDVKDEVAVGREIAAKLLGHFNSYSKDQTALEYVNLVGQTLAQQSGRPELKYHFGVLDTDEMNAFATPGGFVFVTRGLLKSIRSESELAAVLGHEIAHINEKHMYKDIAPKREINASETVVRLLSRGRSDIGASLSKMVDGGMKMLLEKGMGQEKEHAADQAGVLYATAAGYDPAALDVFLKRVFQDRSTIKISKTHPPFDARIKNMDVFLGKNGLTGRSPADEKVMAQRFDRSLASLQRGGAK